MAILRGRGGALLRRPGGPFVGAFTVATLLFLTATVIAQLYARTIDAAATSIARDASVSIDRLAAARGVLRRLERAATTDTAGVEAAREALRVTLREYLASTAPPAGEGLRRDLRSALARLDLRLDAARDDAGTHGAVRRVDEAAEALIALHARRARELAQVIERRRAAATRLAFGLDALSVLLGALATVLAVRVARRYERLVEAHRTAAVRRAEELELFAGRVAHDVRGPLSTVVLALDAAARDAGLEARARTTVARGRRSVDRLLRVVDDLLAFARAGASGEPGAHTAVADVLRDMLDELEPDARQAEVELRCEACPQVEVACAAGVLTSLLSNLLRNAINHMGERTERRVTVRVVLREDVVRVEVEDTGPGLSAEAAGRVFDPYVRGASASKPGIGLGLATVRRLAEAHHGRAGVTSTPERGSTFWFELPRIPQSAGGPHAEERLAVTLTRARG